MQEEKTGASRYSPEAPQVSGQKWYSHPYPLDPQPVLISESHIFRAHGHVFFTREMTYQHFKIGRVPIRIWISDISRKFRRVDNWPQMAAVGCRSAAATSFWKGHALSSLPQSLPLPIVLQLVHFPNQHDLPDSAEIYISDFPYIASPGSFLLFRSSAI